MLMRMTLQEAGHYRRWSLRQDESLECLYPWLLSNSEHIQMTIGELANHTLAICKRFTGPYK